MVDGTFKCFNCDLGYDDYDDYEQHLAEVSHTHNGVAPCSLCGISTEFKFIGKKAVGKLPALCKDCRGNILEEDQL